MTFFWLWFNRVPAFMKNLYYNKGNITMDYKTGHAEFNCPGKCWNYWIWGLARFRRFLPVRDVPLLTFSIYLFKCFFNEAFKPLDGVAPHHHTHTNACLATRIWQYEIKPHGLALMIKQPSFKPHALQSCWSIKMIYCNGSGQSHCIVNTESVSYCRNRLSFIAPRGWLVAG